MRSFLGFFCNGVEFANFQFFSFGSIHRLDYYFKFVSVGTMNFLLTVFLRKISVQLLIELKNGYELL